MANPYPAEFQTAPDPLTRLDGTITFTDPANQPGGGGGGSVDSVTAGDASITIGGTATDPTVAVASAGITAAKLGTGAVGTAAIGAEAVTAAKIGSGAAGSGAVLEADGLGGAAFTAPGFVTGVTAGDASITIGGTATAPTVEVASAGITAAKIGTSAVQSAAIGALQVTAGKIGSGAATNHQVLSADGSGNAVFADPTGVASVSAGDTSIVVGGTGTAPTIETASLDVIAGDHATSGDVSMNSHKITNLTNGAGAQDAAAFGQIPTALPPNGSAGGDLSGTYPNPTVAAIRGVAVSGTPPSANQLLQAVDATHAAWATVGGTGTVTSVTSADTSIAVATSTSTPVLTVAALNTIAANHATSGSVAMNSNKITGLANGSASTDALAVGQVLAANVIPVADLVAGTAGQVLGGTGPSYSLPPGFEIGYTQITSNANITDTSEATGTALISPGALTFDGGPVLVEFYTIALIPPTAAATSQAFVTLFEGSTEITRLAQTETVATASRAQITVYGRYRFAPTAGSHTYKICGFVSSTSGTPAIAAGPGGTAGEAPAFVRFTKV